MTTDEKHDILFNVLEGMINEVENEVSMYFNSKEFKMKLKMKLSNQNVEVDFKDMENTKQIQNITMDKYSVYFNEDLYEDVRNDLVIH